MNWVKCAEAERLWLHQAHRARCTEKPQQQTEAALGVVEKELLKAEVALEEATDAPEGMRKEMESPQAEVVVVKAQAGAAVARVIAIQSLAEVLRRSFL